MSESTFASSRWTLPSVSVRARSPSPARARKSRSAVSAVLEHVRDPARRADVVLEHLPAAVAVADEIAAGDVAVDAARRADAVRGAGEARAGDDQLPRDEPVVDDLAPVVDVVDERVERPDALGEAALDRRPLAGRDDPRHEVERERAVADRSVGVRAGGIERDALLREDRVASAAGLRERLWPERLQRIDERPGVGARRPVRLEHLVVEPLAHAEHARHPHTSARLPAMPGRL